MLTLESVSRFSIEMPSIPMTAAPRVPSILRISPSRYSENMAPSLRDHRERNPLTQFSSAFGAGFDWTARAAAPTGAAAINLKNLWREEKDELLSLLVHSPVLEQVADHRNTTEAGHL